MTTSPSVLESEKIKILYSILGARLKQRRIRLGLTQGDLADMVSISRTSIANIEQGRQRLPIHVLIELSISLQSNVSDFIPNSEELLDQSESNSLDEESMKIINEKSKGDAKTRSTLINFIKEDINN